MGSKLAKLSAFILFLIGSTLLAVGCAIRWKVFPDMLQSTIEDQIQLKKGSEAYDDFITPPVPMYMQFTFFHVENPVDVANKGAMPKLTEIGPYVYKETRHKENVTNGGADTIYYNERRTYVFDADESKKQNCRKYTPTKTSTATPKLMETSSVASTSEPVTTTAEPTECTKDDKVTILSPIWTLVNDLIQKIPKDLDVTLPAKWGIPPPYNHITYKSVQTLMSLVIFSQNHVEDGDGIFMEATVDEILFEGAPTGLTTWIWTLLESGMVPKGKEIIEMINTMFPQFKDGKFGLQKGKNDTVDDMFFRINNGDNDLDEFMKMLEWNGDASLPEKWWQNIGRKPSQTKEGDKGICHDIKGTDGTIFPPGVDKEKDLWVFVPELCRSIWLQYRDDTTVNGIPANQYRPGPDVFDMANPDNFCYCPKFSECAITNKTDDSYDNKPCTEEKYNCLDGLIQVGTCLATPGGRPISFTYKDKPIELWPSLPISMSSPHFYRGDPKLIKAFEGISDPDPAKHDTILNLEPITGITVSAHKRIQINMPLKKMGFGAGTNKPFDKLNQTYPAFPLLWVDERAEIDQKNADRWQSQVGKAFKLVNGLTYSLGLALGGVCVVLSWFLVFFCVKK